MNQHQRRWKIINILWSIFCLMEGGGVLAPDSLFRNANADSLRKYLRDPLNMPSRRHCNNITALHIAGMADVKSLSIVHFINNEQYCISCLNCERFMIHSGPDHSGDHKTKGLTYYRQRPDLNHMHGFLHGYIYIMNAEYTTYILIDFYWLRRRDVYCSAKPQGSIISLVK